MYDLRLLTNVCYLLNTVEVIIFTVVPDFTSALKRIFMTLKSGNNDNILLWALKEGTITGYNNFHA